MVWKEPGQFVSEPIFVPRTISSYNESFSNNGDCDTHKTDAEPCIKSFAEDDGVVIFTLLSSALQKYVQV